AKDADDHEQQADPGERTERSHAKPRLGVGEPFEIAFERAGVRERDVAIDGPDFLANAIEERAGIDGGPDEDAAVTKAGDRVGEKSLGHDGLLQAAVLGVRDDADNFKVEAMGRFRDLIEDFKTDLDRKSTRLNSSHGSISYA